MNGQISYTWSHSIDNQSDPLAGIFEDYNQAGIGHKPDSIVEAAFTQQFASRADRANSDFDQRHNLVFFAVYSLPSKFLRGWQVSGLGAIRSGLPFTVYDAARLATVTSGAFLVNQRANLTGPSLAFSPEVSNIPGGKLIAELRGVCRSRPRHDWQYRPQRLRRSRPCERRFLALSPSSAFEYE